MGSALPAAARPDPLGDAILTPRMPGRIASLMARRGARWAVIASWVILAAAALPLLPKLQERAADESDTFLARGSDSARVDELLTERFPEGGDSTATVVFATDGSIYDQVPEISRLAQEICAAEAIPDLKGVGLPGSIACGELGHDLAPSTPPSPISADETTALAGVVTTEDDTASVVRDVEALREILPGPEGEPLRSYVSGQAGFEADREAALQGIDETLLAITAALVLVLLLAIYRSPLLALVPLLVAGCAYLIAAALILGAVEAGLIGVSGQATAILIVLMFGAGTDYCLLVLARFREQRAAGAEPSAAIEAAAARTGPAILSSGAIVVLAMLVLGLADFNATREMGPVLAIGIAVMVAAGLTLLPAVLVAIASRAPAQTPAGGGVWARVGDLVRSRPTAVATAVTALLVLGALGNLGGREHLDLTEQFRDRPESVLGQDLVREKFPAGRVAPLSAVVEAERSAEATEALRQAPGVADANTDSQSNDGELVSLEILLERDPFSEGARELIPELRERLATAVGAGGTALLGGLTAEAHDNEETIAADARLLFPLTALVVLAVLVVLFRSLITPLYVVATVVLSFAFALGVSSLAFSEVFGQPASDPNLATFAFIFLVALGVDYNIFLLTRIREERGRGLGAAEAAVVGLERTGGVITSAGLILAGTFAALMALELESLFQVGFTIALGLLVDTFLVRVFLVPAIAVRLGERGWPAASAGSKT